MIWSKKLIVLIKTAEGFLSNERPKKCVFITVRYFDRIGEVFICKTKNMSFGFFSFQNIVKFFWKESWKVFSYLKDFSMTSASTIDLTFKALPTQWVSPCLYLTLFYLSPFDFFLFQSLSLSISFSFNAFLYLSLSIIYL